jgi:hypothetical protein
MYGTNTENKYGNNTGKYKKYATTFNIQQKIPPTYGNILKYEKTTNNIRKQYGNDTKQIRTRYDNILGNTRNIQKQYGKTMS